MKWYCAVLVMLLCMRAPVLHTAESDPATDAYTRAYGLVLDEKWLEARREFEGLVKDYPKSRWVEGSRYWLCHIRLRLGDPPDSVYNCYVRFIEQYPKSPWAQAASTNLVALGMAKRVQGRGYESVPFVPMRTSKDEDARLSAIFAMQDQDSMKAFRAASALYDSSKNEIVRSKVVYVIGSFRMSLSTSKLAEIIRHDPSSRIRGDALALLANVRSAESVAKLLEVVGTSESADFRVRALNALLQTRASGLDTLCIRLALQDDKEDVASTAAGALARMGEKIPASAFHRILREGRCESVRQTAFFALAGLNCQAFSTRELEEIGRADPDPIIRLCATQLMQKTGAQREVALAVIEVLNSYRRWGEAGESVLQMIAGNVAERDPREMFEYCAVVDSNHRVAAAALHGLENLPISPTGREFAAVAQYAKHGDLRREALLHIARTKVPVAVATLEEILHKDENADVRRAAIHALASTGKDSATIVLVSVARQDQSTFVRGAAVMALERLGTPAAKEALRDLQRP
jgi:HEAT repeat protein